MLTAIIKTETLRTIIKTLSAVVDESTINADGNGIHVCAVDPAHVAIIKMDITPDSFVQYECGDTETFALDIEKMNSVIGLVKNDTVGLSLKNGRFTMTFGNITRAMNIIDADIIPRMPELDIKDVCLTIKAGQLANAIKAGQSISNAFKISVTDDECARITMTDEGDECEVILEACIDLEKEVFTQFPTDYFQKMIKAIPIDRNVVLDLATDKPMILSFSMDEFPSNVTYLLAPRL